MLDRLGLTLHLFKYLRQVVEVSDPEMVLIQAINIALIVKYLLIEVFVEQSNKVFTRGLLRKDPFELNNTRLHKCDATSISITVGS